MVAVILPDAASDPFGHHGQACLGCVTRFNQESHSITWQEQIYPGSEADHTETLSLLDRSAYRMVGHDSAGDEACDLANQHLASGGGETNGGLLVDETRLLRSGMTKFAGIVMSEGDGAFSRITVDVNIEDVHEDGDPAGATTEKRRLLGLDNAHHLAIGGSEDQAVAPFSRALRIAKERDDPDRQDKPARGGDPHGSGVEPESGDNESQRNEPGSNDEPQALGCSAGHKSCSRFRPVRSRNASR